MRSAQARYFGRARRPVASSRWSSAGVGDGQGSTVPAGVPPRINPCVRATYADAMADLDFDAFALVPKGHAFEDFEAGQLFEHPRGRTLNERDTSLFATGALGFPPPCFH